MQQPKEMPMRLLTREWLVSIRRRGLRQRVWFRILSRAERGIVELTIRYIDEVRSAKLALAIGRIICKVFNASKSRFIEEADMVGRNLAEKISKIAVDWGYLVASDWKTNSEFVRYLGINSASVVWRQTKSKLCPR